MYGDLDLEMYPNLFIIFDGASAFPVKAEAHEVNTENAGQGFDTCPLHCGSLRRRTHVHTVNTHDISVVEYKQKELYTNLVLAFLTVVGVAALQHLSSDKLVQGDL